MLATNKFCNSFSQTLRESKLENNRNHVDCSIIVAHCKIISMLGLDITKLLAYFSDRIFLVKRIRMDKQTRTSLS